MWWFSLFFVFVSLAAVAANKAVSKTLNFVFNLPDGDHIDGGSSSFSPRCPRCLSFMLTPAPRAYEAKQYKPCVWLHTWLVLKWLHGRNACRFPDEKPWQNSTNCILWKARSVPITFRVCAANATAVRYQCRRHHHLHQPTPSNQHI